MKFPILRILWGLLLILAGLLFLLDLSGYISIGDYQWAIILGIGGLAFLSVFISDRKQWWSLFPSFGLLIGAFAIFIDTAFPQLQGDIIGAFVLGALGLAFLLVFLSNFEHWWALIPAGVLLSLGVGLGLSSFIPGLEMGGLFLVGLGITFGVIGFIRTPQGHMRWAFIPAVVLLVIGLFLLAASFNLFLYLWPLALIAAGLLIIYGVIRTRSRIG
jgi:hypothetical protein